VIDGRPDRAARRRLHRTENISTFGKLMISCARSAQPDVNERAAERVDVNFFCAPCSSCSGGGGHRRQGPGRDENLRVRRRGHESAATASAVRSNFMGSPCFDWRQKVYTMAMLKAVVLIAAILAQTAGDRPGDNESRELREPADDRRSGRSIVRQTPN